jgi:alginate O-acetyltransferase complex protein AlgI
MPPGLYTGSYKRRSSRFPARQLPVLFNSYIFLLCFLPPSLVLFHLARRFFGPPASVSCLIFLSLIFYAWWSVRDLVLLCVLLVINYWTGRAQESNWDRAGEGSRILLALILITNLSVLAYFKYTHFFVNSLAVITGEAWSFPALALPLGISFFIFQKLAYQVDSYRGEIRGYGFSEFCAFVLFFPQLIAGPIVYHKDFIPQLRTLKGKMDAELFVRGLTLFFIGLAKKVVIADYLASIASPKFALAAAGAIGFGDAWLGAISYSLQLYFDFSGYSDMAVGLGWLFGIALPFNFNSPYKAASIIDFWRRWHITLSIFLKNYLYIPLGGNRCSPVRQKTNLLLTMVLGGLWHGAGWTFMLWGALHGVYLVANHAWNRLFHFRTWRNRTTWIVIARILTLWAVVVGWVIFRAPDVPVAIRMIRAMHTGFGGFRMEVPDLSSIKIGLRIALPILISAAIALVGLNTMTLFSSEHDPDKKPVPMGMRWTPSTRWAIAFGLVALAAFLSLSRPTEFIYFQF